MERTPERETYVAFGENQSWYRFCEDLREGEDMDGAIGGWAGKFLLIPLNMQKQRC